MLGARFRAHMSLRAPSSAIRATSAIWLIVLILLPCSEPFSICPPADLFASDGAADAGSAPIPASTIDDGAWLPPLSCAVTPVRVRLDALSRAPRLRCLPVPTVGAPARAFVTPVFRPSDRASSSVLRI